MTTDESLTRVLILGSTGSIGTQALEVIADNPGLFEVVGLGAGGGNTDLLIKQARAAGISSDAVAVANPDAAATVGDALGGSVLSGPDAMTDLVRACPADVVLNAVVGSLDSRPASRSWSPAPASHWRTRNRSSPVVRSCSTPPHPAR